MAMELPSNVKTHFLSNNDPLDSSCASIAENRIQYLRQKIRENELDVTRYQQHRHDLEQYMLLLSPLRRIPLELIGEIFTSMLAQDDVHWRTQLVDLCLVCTQWREAALSTPRLWSNVEIFPLRHLLSFDSVTSWLSRAQGFPRTLSVNIIGWNFPGAVRWWEREKVLCDILTHGPSIQTLKIKCRYPFDKNLRYLFKSLQGESSPHLRSWDTIQSFHLINHAPAWKAQAAETESMYLAMPPAITSLAVCFPKIDAIYPRRSTILHIPSVILERLTSLVLPCHGEGVKLFTVMQQCVNLENLTVDFDPFPFDPVLTDHATNSFLQSGVILPNLRMLRLQHIYVENIPNLIDHLGTPRLVCLDIKCRDAQSGQQSDGQSLGNFIRGAPGLYSLHIDNLTFEGDAFGDHILPNVPSLTYLMLNGVAFNRNAILVKEPRMMAMASEMG